MTILSVILALGNTLVEETVEIQRNERVRRVLAIMQKKGPEAVASEP
jgi:hypothetical protein